MAFARKIGGKEFAVIGHGIGHRRATETARRAFDLMPDAELVIGTGVVGALSSGLKPGDLVLSDRALTIDADGRVDEQVAAVGDAHLRAIGRSLANAGIAYSTGAILTSHRVLATGAEKRRAKESTGAIAVDMETAAIAAEATARGLPFVAIRAVLDEVDDEVVGAEMADRGRQRQTARRDLIPAAQSGDDAQAAADDSKPLARNRLDRGRTDRDRPRGQDPEATKRGRGPAERKRPR